MKSRIRTRYLRQRKKTLNRRQRKKTIRLRGKSIRGKSFYRMSNYEKMIYLKRSESRQIKALSESLKNISSKNQLNLNNFFRDKRSLTIFKSKFSDKEKAKLNEFMTLAQEDAFQNGEWQYLSQRATEK